MQIFDMLSEYEEYVNSGAEGDFKDYTITIEGNTHTLTQNTRYHTPIVTTITKVSKSWHVVRTGGLSYDLVITPLGDEIYSVRFDNIYNHESKGDANLTVQRLYRESISGNEGAETTTIHLVGYAIEGKMTMVDNEADKERPLTIVTNIVEPLVADKWEYGYTDGELYIDCYDERFDSHDRAVIYIDEYNNDRAIINCYGEYETASSSF